jgi:hypothetical protein
MRQLHVFSYLPNPRIRKATIASRLAGVNIEVRGGSPKELPYLEKTEGTTQADP